MIQQELQHTIQMMTMPGKGILAADESTGTIGKRFSAINLENTEENRRAYRDLLLSADGLENHISGVILFEETLGQSTAAGQPFPALLKSKGIATGIKVDKGIADLPFYPKESVTQGLDGLAGRLKAYKAMGAQFAKWRAVFTVSKSEALPTCHAVQVNADALAHYAAICQSLGIVPMVEPEVLMDGDHHIDYCEKVTTMVLNIVFEKLNYYRVSLEHMILKPNMIVAGLLCPFQPSVAEVAERTVRVLKRTTPAAVPGIAFLSGGQADALATEHLSAINAMGPLPWSVSFSYGRALQAPVLKTWGGHAHQVHKAQQVLIKRSELNGLAALGQYKAALEV